MNIILRKRNKKWHYDFNLNGKRYRESTHTETKELAKLYAQKIYNETYLNKHHIKNSNVLLNEFIQLHLKTQENNLSRMWLYTKKQILNKFKIIAQEQGIEFIQDVSVEFLEKYKMELLKNNKPKTAQNTLGIIQTMLKHAVKLKYIQENPVTQLDIIRGIQKNKQKYLTKEDIETLLKASKAHYFKDLILVGIYSGMRRGELINLCFEDVDREKKLIYIKNKDNFKTKSRKERVLPLHQNLYQFFNENKHNKGYCFTKNKDPLNPKTLSLRFVKLCNDLNFKEISLHTLRHTFISWCLIEGISIFKVAKWAGHSTTHITELYGHLCAEEKTQRDIDKLNF